ncbi:PREDICTED: histone deacetylase complex subunit SAP30L, partial [Phaethon lepturus]|uniref:histone deacetylase complex subunit SAP30L n=1 Tax=Phaethon lepturus TaxID=97097 RepID=UPI00053059CC
CKSELLRLAGGRGAGPRALVRGWALSSRVAAERLLASSDSSRGEKRAAEKRVRHLYICDFHKNFIQSVRNKRKRKTSDDGGDSPEHETDVPEVDLFQLQVNTLRRYKRHYKLQTRPGLNKAQLAETVSRHFRNIPVNEKETLAYFIYMVKNNKSRLDQKSEGSKQLE